MPTTKPCRKCGKTDRYTETNACRPCAIARAAAYTAANPSKVAAAKKTCYENNRPKTGHKPHPEHINCIKCNASPNEWYCMGMCRACYEQTKYAGRSEEKKMRDRAESSTAEYKTRIRRWEDSNIAKVLFHSAKRRAKKHNIPFTITEADIVVTSVCPALGIPLVRGKGVLHANSPSLDRIAPHLGYTVGNIQVISHKANSMKNNATSEELLRFAAWVTSSLT